VDRQRHLDGLRGLASLYVVLHHAWLTIWPLGHFPTGPVMTATGWLMWGHFAVAIFIVLSGYCLTLPVIQRGPRSFSTPLFLRRRARRILPPYYLSCLLTVALVYTCIGQKTGTHWDITLPLSAASIARAVLLIPEFGTSINHVYWSIGVECKIYLLFPLLLACFSRFGVLRSAAAATLITFPLAYAVRDGAYASASPHFIALFCLGAAAAHIVNSPEPFWVRLRKSSGWAACLCGAILATVGCCLRFGFAPHRLFAIDWFVGVAAVALLILAGRSPASRLRQLLSFTPLVAAGTFSYSLYLIHAPLLQVVWQYAICGHFQQGLPQFVALCALGVPFILLCAWSFYLVCEKPVIGRAISVG
jgi:peptidoglycan/LPS O-acetylase OafA/YrhL